MLTARISILEMELLPENVLRLVRRKPHWPELTNRFFLGIILGDCVEGV